MVAANVDTMLAGEEKELEQTRTNKAEECPSPSQSPRKNEKNGGPGSSAWSGRRHSHHFPYPGSPRSSPPTVIEENAHADHLNDEFGVLKIIDEGAAPQDRSASLGDSPFGDSQMSGLDSGITQGSLDWARGPSPSGFASPFSADDTGVNRAGAEKKSRRWTVNIPSLAHFGEDSSNGIFLPPLQDDNQGQTLYTSNSSLDSLSAGGNSDGGSVGSPPGFDSQEYFQEGVERTRARPDELGVFQKRKQELEEMEREEERLRLQLERIQKKKQQMETSTYMGGRSMSPPPSPPRAPPGLPVGASNFDDPISARRRSHLDSSSVSSWGNYLPPPPPIPTSQQRFPGSVTSTIHEVGGPLGELPEYNPAYKRNVAAQRRHTAAGIESQNYGHPMFNGFSEVHVPPMGYMYASQPGAAGYYPPGAQAHHAMNAALQQVPTNKQKTGPVGANLFVFNFPRIFSNADLERAFEPFGNVLSATVFIDKLTQRSKCFGFVSYDSPEAAQLAIDKMNGAQLGGKTIKVQLKREPVGGLGGLKSNPQETTAVA